MCLARSLRHVNLSDCGLSLEDEVHICEALRDTPRLHQLRLLGIDLGCAARTLGLTPNGQHWPNDAVAAFLRECHASKALAFGMGQHAVLGAASPVSCLSHDEITRVLETYFGVPPGRSNALGPPER
jgi:hypothetical protein